MILQIKNLKTHFFTRDNIVKAVDDISLEIPSGEIHGIAGESGSGKSVMGLSIINLLQEPGKIVGGNIYFNGKEITKFNDISRCNNVIKSNHKYRNSNDRGNFSPQKNLLQES